jgi:probable rRNA maturation factor
VLSFPFYTSLKEIKKAAKCGETLLGDIVVNLHIADRRAREEGKTVEDEVYHLLIHGLLHLLGYDHEKNRRQALAMKKKESELLDAVKKMD